MKKVLVLSLLLSLSLQAHEHRSEAPEAGTANSYEHNMQRETQEEAAMRKRELNEYRNYSYVNPVKSYQEARTEVVNNIPTAATAKEDSKKDSKTFWLGDTTWTSLRPRYTSEDLGIQTSAEQAQQEREEIAALKIQEQQENKALDLRRQSKEIEDANPSLKSKRYLVHGFVKMFDTYIVGNKKIPTEGVLVGDKHFSKEDLSDLKNDYESSYSGYEYGNLPKPEIKDYIDKIK